MSNETRARATIAGFVTATALLALLAVGAGGCGGGSDTAPPPGNDADVGTPTVTTGPYQPLTVGSTWTYHVDDQGVVYDKQSSVEAFEDMGGAIAGTMGFKVRETVKASIQLTWYEQTATDVRRHHDQLADDTGRQLSDEWYSPYLLRVDEAPEHLTAGATWTINYTQDRDHQQQADRRRPTRPRPGPSTPSTSSPRCRRERSTRSRSRAPTPPTARPRRSGSSAASARSASAPAPATSKS